MSTSPFVGVRRKFGALMIGVASVAVTFGVTPALAAAAPKPDVLVRNISIESKLSEGSRSVLTLTFDAPISRGEADRIKQDMQKQVTIQDPFPQGEYLSCEGDISRTNTEGTFTLQYVCFTGYGTLPWSFRLSPAVQAIVVGNVNEDGLRWWRNGASQPKNAPHSEPPDYRFHGTMNPVYHNDHVQYQDFLTFRHRIGPGGTGSVTFAGAVNLIP
jgi:hypothetical protein